MGRFGRATVECYDCHQQVADLKRHRTAGEPGSCTRRRARGGGSRQTGNAHRLADLLRSAPGSDAVESFEDSKDVYFIIDVSGSMGGSRLEQAKEAVRQVHEKMADTDRMAIITFDSEAVFKLKPRPNGQLKRQGEINPLLDPIYANGLTALYDAVWMAVSQIRDKTRKTLLTVLTDGADNSSQHTLEEVLSLVEQYPAITLDIVHVSGQQNAAYRSITEKGSGTYELIVEDDITVQIVLSHAKFTLTVGK